VHECNLNFAVSDSIVLSEIQSTTGRFSQELNNNIMYVLIVYSSPSTCIAVTTDFIFQLSLQRSPLTQKSQRVFFLANLYHSLSKLLERNLWSTSGNGSQLERRREVRSGRTSPVMVAHFSRWELDLSSLVSRHAMQATIDV